MRKIIIILFFVLLFSCNIFWGSRNKPLTKSGEINLGITEAVGIDRDKSNYYFINNIPDLINPKYQLYRIPVAESVIANENIINDLGTLFTDNGLDPYDLQIYSYKISITDQFIYISQINYVIVLNQLDGTVVKVLTSDLNLSKCFYNEGYIIVFDEIAFENRMLIFPDSAVDLDSGTAISNTLSPATGNLTLLNDKIYSSGIDGSVSCIDISNPLIPEIVYETFFIIDSSVMGANNAAGIRILSDEFILRKETTIYSNNYDLRIKYRLNMDYAMTEYNSRVWLKKTAENTILIHFSNHYIIAYIVEDGEIHESKKFNLRVGFEFISYNDWSLINYIGNGIFRFTSKDGTGSPIIFEEYLFPDLEKWLIERGLSE